MSDYQPTGEQHAVIEACVTGANLVVEAAAGAGKTSTLRMAAGEMGGAVLYVAYNKAAAGEAAASFPGHVKCSTVHALAFGAVGRQFADRLNSPRQTAKQAAQQLGVRDQVEIGAHLLLTPVHVAKLALETVQRFCYSAEQELHERHLPAVLGLPSVAELGRLHRAVAEHRAAGDHQAAGEVLAAWENGLRARRDLAAAVLPVAHRAWVDIQDPAGRKVRFQHDHYLKLWALGRPQLPYDVVMLDEAQDSNPVTADLVTSQQCQRIAIGDGCQQLYAWRGAVDALATWPAQHRLYLTQSWRFGQVIADEANKWLALLGTDLMVRGNPGLPSVIGPVPEPDAVLCRTNAGAVGKVMAFLDAGMRPALVGGADELVRMAQAAEDLQAGKRTSHPELFAFKSWGEVQAYADEPAGSDLRTFVRLVDDHGPDKIIAALSQTVSEDRADVVVSTGHKAKGREWGRVQIHTDFPEPKEGDPVPRADAMLAYVAVTRAKLALDRRGLAWVDKHVGPAAQLAGAVA